MSGDVIKNLIRPFIEALIRRFIEPWLPSVACVVFPAGITLIFFYAVSVFHSTTSRPFFLAIFFLAFCSGMAWYLAALDRGARIWEVVVVAIGNVLIFVVTAAMLDYYLNQTHRACFYIQPPPANPLPFGRTTAFYFAVTSFTTVGYGDIRPISPSCRIWTSGQLLIGLLWGVLILANLLNKLRHLGTLASQTRVC